MAIETRKEVKKFRKEGNSLCLWEKLGDGQHPHLEDLTSIGTVDPTFISAQKLLQYSSGLFIFFFLLSFFKFLPYLTFQLVTFHERNARAN